MNRRLLWRLSLVVLVSIPLVASTGCHRWRWRDKHHEIEVDYGHDGPRHYDDHDGHPGHPHHPLGGPPGQMKKHHH